MSLICFSNQDNNKTINLELSNLKLIRKKQKIIDFNIELSCAYSDYQNITNEHYFNLSEESKSALFIDEFNDNLPIKIKLRSNDNIRKKLLKKGHNEEQIKEYLLNPKSIEGDNKDKDKAINWQIDDWYCLEVNQKQEDKTIGYSTLWHKLAVKKNKSKNKRKNNLQNFWTEAQAEEISAEWEKTGDKISDFFEELIDTFDENVSQSKTNKSKTISQVTKEFFFADNWNYLQLNDGRTLQVNCQGKNGQINCYARSYDEQSQLIFYSLYPMPIPEDKRAIVAELITKINYGMIIGNLEMDFADGELRYKTSIDVDGDRLSTALVKRLVYGNVLTMDEYLPAITAIVNEESTIDEAIKLVENQ